MDNSSLLAKLLRQHSAIEPVIEHMQAHCCEINIHPTGSNRQNWAHETVVQDGLNLGSGKSGKREELAAKSFVILHTEFQQGFRHFTHQASRFVISHTAFRHFTHQIVKKAGSTQFDRGMLPFIRGNQRSVTILPVFKAPVSASEVAISQLIATLGTALNRPGFTENLTLGSAPPSQLRSCSS